MSLDLEALKEKANRDGLHPDEALALIAELEEANAAHDDAETRADDASLDLCIANEALSNLHARLAVAEAELEGARRVEWATGICSAHQRPDPLCRICNPALAEARRERDDAEAAALAMSADLTRVAIEHKTKRKPARAPNLPVWAWCARGGAGLWCIGFGPPPSSDVDSVEYVKRDRDIEAVVKTAVAWSEAPFEKQRAAKFALVKAVERYAKRKGKR